RVRFGISDSGRVYTGTFRTPERVLVAWNRWIWHGRVTFRVTGPGFAERSLPARICPPNGLVVTLCFMADSHGILAARKQRASGPRRGKDMLYSGKVLLKVTPPVT